jgi:Cu2+-containing amine oxidase
LFYYHPSGFYCEALSYHSTCAVLAHLESFLTMVLDRLKQVAMHVSGTKPAPHPFDPLSAQEIETTAAIVRKEHSSLYYNAISVQEPRKAVMQAWLADPDHAPKPHRVADVVAIGKGSKVYDGLVDLDEGKIISWEATDGVQPLITMEDLQVVEHVVRKDPKVIEQCAIIGIRKEEMHKVYCDRECTPAEMPAEKVADNEQLGRSATTNGSATRSDCSKR